MKTLIVYFSSGGSTKIVSRTLSMNLKADIIEIKDLKDRKGFGKRLLSSIEAFRESKTKISPENIDFTDYDLIYLGTPTWANNPAPAIITLVDNCDWKGKDVIIFTTLTNSGGDSALERLEEKVSLRGGRVIKSFSIITKDKTPEDLINDTEAAINASDLKMYGV